MLKQSSIMSSLLSFLCRSNSKKSSFLSSRAMRVEPLEDRTLLSSDGVVYGPVYVDQTLINPDTLMPFSSVRQSSMAHSSDMVPISRAAVYSAIYEDEVAGMLNSATLIESSDDGLNSDESPIESFFGDTEEEFNDSVQHVVFASQLSGLIPSDDDIIVDDVNVTPDSEQSNVNSRSGGGSGGGIYSYSLTVTAFSSLESDADHPNALSESRCWSQSGNSQLSDVDYLLIDVPEMPADYFGRIVFSGEATYGSDYGVFLQTGDNWNFVSGSSAEFSGGSTRFYLVPFGDSYVESKYESIIITLQPPTFLGSGGATENVQFEYGDLTASATLVDASEFRLDEVSFRGNLNLISDTQGSFGQSWQLGPHWYANSLEMTLPIAYSSNQKLGMYAQISGDIDSNNQYEIIARRVNGGTTDWISLTSSYQSGSEVFFEFTDSFTSIFGNQRAFYDPESTIIWSYRVNGGEERAFASGADRSVNTLYITYEAPTVSSGELFHTSVHHGCVVASSVDYLQVTVEDTPQEIADKIQHNCNSIYEAVCEKFTSRSVEKINLINGNVQVGETLTYYAKTLVNENNHASVRNLLSCTDTGDGIVFHEYPTRAREFASNHNPEGVSVNCSTYDKRGLLFYLDGTCSSWQQFMINVLGAQGLNDVHAITLDFGGHYAFKVSTSLRGQGGGVPGENTWTNHAIIRYKNRFYDPSYGLEYGTSEAEAKSSFVSNVSSIGTLVAAPEHNSTQPNPYAGFGCIYYPSNISSSTFITWLRSYINN